MFVIDFNAYLSFDDEKETSAHIPLMKDKPFCVLRLNQDHLLSYDLQFTLVESSEELMVTEFGDCEEDLFFAEFV